MSDATYQQLRLLVSAPRLARSIAIGSRFCPPAHATLERLGLAGVVASAAVDRQLLEAGQRAPRAPAEGPQDPGPLLCLRCRVSQAADQKIQALVRRFGRSHQLDAPMQQQMAGALGKRPRSPPGRDPATGRSACR